MASEALSIPGDIPWRRVAWSREMMAVPGGAPLPKWRSSAAIYAYAVPLVDTEDDYPDARIVYLKLSLTITGWTLSEVIPEASSLPTDLDSWQGHGWDYVTSVGGVQEYQPCLSAIAQIAIYPRPTSSTDLDEYPYFIDFEPKKRELYETVSETGEVMSGSARNVDTRKGRTTTRSTEMHVDAGIKGLIPGVGIGSANVGMSRQTTTEDVDITTTDASTERRETAGRSTQLSQMYQLFNGYHPGTNRALFAIFARPHTVTEADQVDSNLVNGERRLEGVQDIFLVVHAPRTMGGFCIEAWLDTAHKHVYPHSATDAPGTGTLNDNSVPMVITRRIVGGCAAFDGDQVKVVSGERPDVLRQPAIVGEDLMDRGPQILSRGRKTTAAVARSEQVAAADHLNFVQTDVRRVALSAAAAARYQPRRYIETAAFRQVAAGAFRASTMPLEDLVPLHYLSHDELAALRRRGIVTVGDLFGSHTEPAPEPIAPVRRRLLDALIKSAPAG